ncbi:uncharacterized protein EV154DRAFT_554875 [Mucor mucedo]|uniref:uncharacterized protein n=1 Tax=Mucor mucedo TaxID=29922 RepID=UPI0022207A7A|nr:uncharacterized protein EV154DRAFT_554875 [Mucor mucedo]KAI7884456.1 hypothetical protein EV154DRAFT_554875 [Mucor mucedo]
MEVQYSKPVFVGLGIVGPDSLEIISEFISLICITVLAAALGSKTFGEKLKTINYGRVMVILLYFLSWSFATTSAVIVSTNNNNMTSCTLGMLSCDIFYAGSKIVVYAWLIERIHLVTAVKTSRLKTRIYRFHLVLLCPYVIIFALMLAFRNIYLEPDGKCTIGLQLIASVPLLCYDFILNLYLTWLFMAPLMNVGLTSRANWKRSRLYKLARRTLVSSIVSLLISFANVLVVVITQGHERGLVCLTMCTVDVTINAVVVHWVTTNRGGNSKDTRNKTFHNTDHLSAELTFDAPAETGDKQPKFEFASIHDSKSNEDDEDDSESIRSTQISQLSAKPLHNY